MNKNFLLSIFYGFLFFCIVSYFSVMISLFQSIGKPSLKPVANIGFPIKYYYQFWLRGSDSPNCGWNIKAFFIDGIISWIIGIIIVIIANKKKNKSP